MKSERTWIVIADGGSREGLSVLRGETRTRDREGDIVRDRSATHADIVSDRAGRSFEFKDVPGTPRAVAATRIESSSESCTQGCRRIEIQP